ncbi:MAG: 3-oxoacyl-ACP reductase, partial [Deltaproteobacteria bacterium]
MRVAFLGATKGMGRALARLMAERGDALCLLGRNVADLERSA